MGTYRVEHDYLAKSADELTVEKGDIIIKCSTIGRRLVKRRMSRENWVGEHLIIDILRRLDLF